MESVMCDIVVTLEQVGARRAGHDAAPKPDPRLA
jgi:hypothetical protein